MCPLIRYLCPSPSSHISPSKTSLLETLTKHTDKAWDSVGAGVRVPRQLRTRPLSMHEDVGVHNYPHRCGHLDGAEKIGDAWNNFESFEVCRLAFVLFRTSTPSSHLLHPLVIYSFVCASIPTLCIYSSPIRTVSCLQ
ncbi:hypothetical protein GALMADRAFT_1129703 [Galerina marginata CBS 339.88]|uniref:Uncharacterized protein n=1 Tax=Galerina marginata (strain CBS 339.88) TaxID=685588 RepID=A0A067SAY5_GALM3|nr:hypothetical protein GALMADRAFT_1129703 [Galerina marginata CBS 339.88]